MPNGYSLVRLRNGACSVRSAADDETFHPGIGPAAEAESLYVRQLRLPERLRESPGDFVLWDVGLGAGANAVTALRLIRKSPVAVQTRLRMISFDRTIAAAAFALEHAAELGYLAGCDALLAELIDKHAVQFEEGHLRVEWSLELGDFPARLERRPLPSSPQAILFDPHSPKKNPEMWTVSLFENIFRSLDPKRPCALATFTRSTLVRTGLLLAGFFVGAGRASGLKEETTVAASRLEWLDHPLDRRWLDRAARSHSAEPLRGAEYRQSRLSVATLEALRSHPQFQSASGSRG